MPDAIAEHRAQLVETSLAARRNAYCPYSNYQVGAALLLRDPATGECRIVSGCNVENASYPCGACAEKTAIGNAVAQGYQGWDFLCCCVSTRDGGSPCGQCRQVLNEFGPNMLVIEVDANGETRGELRLPELLAGAFGPRNLQK